MINPVILGAFVSHESDYEISCSEYYRGYTASEVVSDPEQGKRLPASKDKIFFDKFNPLLCLSVGVRFHLISNQIWCTKQIQKTKVI